MKITGLNHLAIICSNYQRSKAFYTEVLPFKILSETYREERDSYKLDLLLPGVLQIELFSFPNPPARVTNPEAMGLRHLAFSVDEMDREVAKLKAKGIAVEPIRVDPITGGRYTFFPDPDGLPIELCEPAKSN